MASSYDQPTEPCPWCGRQCDCDWVDVGVGLVQAGPYHCEHCQASQVGPHDDTFAPNYPESDFNKPGPTTRTLTPVESKAGWYAPESGHGSSANVIDGRIVSHRQALAAYRKEFVGNPLWHDKAYVEQWRADQRGNLEPTPSAD